jgi:hypothetical protein
MANSIVQCAAAFNCDCFHPAIVPTVPSAPAPLLALLGVVLAMLGLGIGQRRLTTKRA